MLAWIHTLHGNEHVGAETPWWKVRNWFYTVMNDTYLTAKMKLKICNGYNFSADFAAHNNNGSIEN